MNTLPLHPPMRLQIAAWLAPRHLQHLQRPQRQSGMVLLVALIMLLLVTLLGVTSVRMLTVEERMAANSFDRNLAFQAAETALREGEAEAADAALRERDARAAQPGLTNQATQVAAGFPAVAMDCNDLNNGACANGLCSASASTCPDARWQDDAFNGWRNAASAVSPLAAGTPQFFVEHLGSDFHCRRQQAQPPVRTCKRYRVIARSSSPADDGAVGRAVVILESIYAAE